ncbi:MAG TPA: hypothetical protein VM759_11820, partial [Longimicrobium sp.]|nr:hypothetical protein [Longimicrobium sp.]
MSTPPTTLAPAPRAVTVDELCEHLTRLGRADDALLCEFARTFFAKAPRHLLESRGADQLAAMTLGAWEFLRRARPDQVNVQVIDPEEEGWNAGLTVVRAEVGDRPFIVDTIREYLAGEDLPIHHYVYPVLRVRRDAAGEIVGVGGDEGTLEALTHAEVARVHDPARRETIREGVAHSLGDVVRATSDFDAMVAQAETLAGTLEEYAARLPERADELTEQARFLRWLAQGNYVFLGYREYAIRGEGDQETVAVEPASGLGILRDPSSSSYTAPVPLREMDPDLRRRLLEGFILSVTKSNRESTVHRRVRMDYVGVKVLDEQGRVRGERRFLGLFTSQAYDSGASGIPIVRGKLEQVLARSGARPGGHDYKEIVTLLDTMPKEELFQASVEELGEQVHAALDSLFTEAVRVVARVDRARLEWTVMVTLPRGRYSVDARDTMGEWLAEQVGGRVVDLHAVMDTGDRARLYFYVSMPAGVEAPAGRALEREMAALVRTWEERLEDALREVMDEAEAARLANTYGPSFSLEYRAANAPTAAVHDVLYMERLERSDGAVDLNLRQPLPGEAAPAG